MISGSSIRPLQETGGNLDTLQAADKALRTNLATLLGTGNFDKGMADGLLLFRIVKQTQSSMESTANPFLGLASAQFARIFDFVGGNIFSIPKGFQNALRTIQTLICVGMDS